MNIDLSVHYTALKTTDNENSKGIQALIQKRFTLWQRAQIKQK